MLRKLKSKSEFTTNVLTLMSGTILTQIITLAASPVMTRIFSPEDFGVSALFLSISGVLMVVVTGRYEMAIVQTKKRYDAIALIMITLIFTILSSIVLFVICFFSKDNIYFINLNDRLNGLILLIPLYVFFVVNYKTITNYLNREKSYKIIATNQVFQSIFQVFSKFTLGLSGTFSNGLVLGTIVGQFLALVLLLYRFFKFEATGVLFKIALQRLKYNIFYFKDFPKILLGSDLINVLAIQTPFLLTSYFYSTQQLGHLSLAYAMSSAPLTFIGTSLSRVFRQQVASNYNQYGKCDVLFLKMLKKLVVYITLPFVIIFFSAPFLFETIFGVAWKESGVMVQILIIMFYFQFFARVFNYMYILTNHQKDNFKIQLLLLLGVLIPFFIGYVIFNNLYFSLFFYVMIYSSVYVYTIYKSYYYSKGV